MSEWLKDILACNDPFGGVAVILSGDPAQLSPVKGMSVWHRVDNPKASHDLSGYLEYIGFTSVVELTENRRVDPADPDAVEFLSLLDRIRDGTCTKDDWILLCEKCTLDSMGFTAWKNRGFDNTETVRLFLTNVEVDTHNGLCLHELGKPILLSEAKNSKGAKGIDEERFRGMKSAVHLAEGAQVMLTQNTSAPLGLVNGTTGVVKDFVFAEGVEAPCLPEYVWVDCGDQYKGETFFENNPERKGWVPIYPVENTYITNRNKRYSRTGLPLRLCWALTVWKAQGQTIRGCLVVKLGDAEKSHGLTYTAFSRATRLSDIGIVGGLTREWIMEKIQNGKGTEPRIKEERRLRKLAATTEQEIRYL